jgi:hypothetical protein
MNGLALLYEQRMQRENGKWRNSGLWVHVHLTGQDRGGIQVYENGVNQMS